MTEDDTINKLRRWDFERAREYVYPGGWFVIDSMGRIQVTGWTENEFQAEYEKRCKQID